MWNRVVLLTCGMVVGWGIANLFTCAISELGRHRYRVGLAAAIGLGLSVWIGWDAPGSGVSSLLILALCAFVSYAARARQISGQRQQVLLTPSEVSESARTAILLIADALPAEYVGPEHWVARLLEAKGNPVRDGGWFSRPLVLSRLRKACAGAASPPATSRYVAEIESILRAQLPSDALVTSATLSAAPTLEQAIIGLNRDEVGGILVVPIDVSDAEASGLDVRVQAARLPGNRSLMETLPPIEVQAFRPGRAVQELHALLGKAQPLDEPPLAPAALDGLETRVIAAWTVLQERVSPTEESAAAEDTPTAPEDESEL